ncbi:uncharacterized protein EV154DRAFT_606830 [Mucor mucedo]|uniref:uncharacterized protein n=1 Tax=Mucor mucedo TaxID=29922 RepID=UPI00221F8DDC|nr:uncharacterized protein EV154DRAFT_606830 [Mucor mucedo]KAI7875533.1 hypothetical protein EV154DRAFT_606830 [Mucor mucedo]
MAFKYSDYGLIVSIEFGTTFSGSCYAIAGRMSPKELRETIYPSIIHIITDWPKQNKLKHKTPSAIVWAFRRTGNTSQLELLCLRATIDYFRELFDHTARVMQNANMAQGTTGDIKIDKENIRFVITVPAQWNDVQRAIMRNVAKEAGLISEEDHKNRLLVINESLAATLYCNAKTGLMGKNDKYMICDAGGGTVKLAVFESTDNGDEQDNDSFRRCQLTADSGKKCGSVYLDLKMKEVLLDICFGADKKSWENNESKIKELESLITPLTDQFLINKTNFGTARKDFIPDCCREIFENYDSNTSDYEEPRCCVCDFAGGSDAQFVDLDNFVDDTVFVITESKILDKLRLEKGPGDEIITEQGVTVVDDEFQCKSTLTYKYMRENVFDEVINNTIELVRRQIKKANGEIKRIYLVGGFGGLPYLRKRILNEFPADSPLHIGSLIQDDRGDAAAMRGALVYAIDGSRHEPQSDVVFDTYKNTSTSKYNALICLDIGYDGIVCSYRDLRNSGDNMTDIVDWPGLDRRNPTIPTAKEALDGKTLWGAQVKETGIRKPESFVTLSKLMSAMKETFKAYLVDLLKYVLEHVHNSIMKTNPYLLNKSKYRYVITMENCYQFFGNKSEMREIAQLAGVIKKDDSLKRLLLIRREDAAAIYFEKNKFPGKKAQSNCFLQINLYHDTCHLSLHLSTQIGGNDTPKASDANRSGESISDRFRNVRRMRSATFEFDLVARLVTNLSLFISNAVCCKDQKTHDTADPAYILELRRNFLEYLKNKLDHDSNEAQTIPVTQSPGCQVSITKYEFLEYVFWPAIRDLTSAIKSNGMQRNVFRIFDIDWIFLSGFSVEAKKETSNFLERIVIKTLSEALSIPSSRICSSAISERVSRRSYAIQVCGYKRQKFEIDIEKNISEMKLRGGKNVKNDIYNEEAANAYSDVAKPVNLYYQSSYNSSLKDSDSLRTRTIFYAEEECIVYASIYSSDDPTSIENGSKHDLSGFYKIHQFELYIKRDIDDPTTIAPESRLHFDVSLKFDRDESIFEAFACSKLGQKIPNFRFEDQFLVANIYGNENRIIIEESQLTRTE